MNSINITTTSERLDLCSATVWSLINQDVIPDRINIWVSKDAYMADSGIKQIPIWLDQFNIINDIVRFRFVENTGPYRKVIPVLRESKDDDVIVYADDDVIYGRKWYRILLEEFIRNNCDVVVASRVRLTKRNILGNLQSYHRFQLSLTREFLARDYIITGVGGCILQKKHIRSDLINSDEFINVAPKTDDVWISKLLVLSNAIVLSCPDALKEVLEISHDNSALSSSNNISLSGGLVQRFSKRIRNRVFGYFGCRLSNNDDSIFYVNKFFSKSE